MSADLAEAELQTIVESAPEADGSPGLRRFRLDGRKLRVLGLLAVIIAAQAGLMLLLLPAPPENTAAEGHASLSSDEPLPEAKDIAVVESPIGEFNTTNSRASSGSIIHVSFKLVALVAANEREPFAQAVNSTHEARVREAVEKVVRSTSIEDLRDPNYVMLKRRIKSDINKVLRKSYVIEAVIRDFKTIEQ